MLKKSTLAAFAFMSSTCCVCAMFEKEKGEDPKTISTCHPTGSAYQPEGTASSYQPIGSAYQPEGTASSYQPIGSAYHLKERHQLINLKIFLFMRPAV